MRKLLSNRNLDERPAARAILALTLAMTLAAFGCTTNRMPGNGDPAYGSPTGGAMPASATPGSSSGTTGTPPPMTSSYRSDAAGITVNAAPQRQSPDDAAAIIASQRRVLILGTSAPGAGSRPYVSDGRTNQFTYPALVTNPQLTVNSSIHSVNTGAAITSGAGGNAAIADAAVFPDTGTIVTPTSAALAVSPGAVAGGAVAVSPATGAVTGTTSAAATPTTAALNVSPTVASSTGGARAVGVRGATTANSVQITNTNGRVTVTNVAPVTASGRSQ